MNAADFAGYDRKTLIEIAARQWAQLERVRNGLASLLQKDDPNLVSMLLHEVDATLQEPLA